MRIGLMISTSLPGEAEVLDVAKAIVRAEADGFKTVWTSGRFDGLTQLALVATSTRRIELGTAVVPLQPRHPAALAQQAMTVHAASGGRVTLGIGLGHRASIHDVLGLDWSAPIGQAREYLAILRQLADGQTVQHAGRHYRISGYRLAAADGLPRLRILLAALQPRMLGLAGELADGTITWLGGPRYIADVVSPAIGDAAAAAGRPAPRIVAGIPVVLTNRPDEVRRLLATGLARQAAQPSYRAVLNLNGSPDPGAVALVGDESALDAGLDAYASAGVTDLAAQVFPTDEDDEAAATYDWLRRHATSG